MSEDGYQGDALNQAHEDNEQQDDDADLHPWTTDDLRLPEDQPDEPVEVVGSVGQNRAPAPPDEPVEEPQADLLPLALAQHFGTTPERVTGFMVVVEHETDEGSTLSSAWSITSTPWWRLGIVEQVREHLRPS
jgi:hypothetical protein